MRPQTVRNGAPRRALVRLGAVVTLLATLAVVGGLVLLLDTVQHRGEVVETQRMLSTALAGHLYASDSTGVSATLDALTEAGVADDELAALRAFTEPGSPTAVAVAHSDAQQAAGRLDDILAERAAAIDRQIHGVYAALLTVVAIAWSVWFVRLARHHRRLEGATTESEALAASEKRLLTLVQNGSDLVTVFDADGRTTFVSPSIRTVLGVWSESVLGGRVVDLLSADDVPALVGLMAVLREGAEHPVHVRAPHADGRLLVLEGMLSNRLTDSTVEGYVMTVRDVSERHALEERLTYQAFHDSLTGLANRQLFTDRLGHALATAHGEERRLVVLYCDLDDFKNVNDSRGHGVGDGLLSEVGARIGAAVRTGDTAARLGGDEFAVLMEDTDLDEGLLVAERMLAALAVPITVDGTGLQVQISIGLATAVPGETSAEEVLRNADVAMYWAKDRGKSTVAIYDARLHDEALARLQLRSDLQRALRDDQLGLHYQPIVNLVTGTITGFEALARWHHPIHGLLQPAEFIPLAEETGLILPLGSWVLRTACTFAASLQGDWRRPTLAVNVAARQLAQPGFVEEVLSVLDSVGLPAHRLTLEITESVVLTEFDTVAPRLAALRAAGVRIAIDDFGTGYSSLSYLSRLPVDVLKIDKSFVDGIPQSEHHAALTRTILEMSRSLDMSTVAEGVENAAQAEWLRGQRCTFGQGFLWSKPVDDAGVQHLLAALPVPPQASPVAKEQPALPKPSGS